jgi:hypothetical protein
LNQVARFMVVSSFRFEFFLGSDHGRAAAFSFWLLARTRFSTCAGSTAAMCQ